MGLRPPGSRSNITLLISGSLTILSLLALIGGHVVLALLVYVKFIKENGGGMEHLAKFIGLDPIYLWASIAVALALDVWIAVSTKHDREKKIRRR